MAVRKMAVQNVEHLSKCRCGGDPVKMFIPEDYGYFDAYYSVKCEKCGMKTDDYLKEHSAEDAWELVMGGD